MSIIVKPRNCVLMKLNDFTFPYKQTLQYIHSLLRNTQSVHSPLMVVLVGVWRRGASSRNTVYRNDRALNRTTAPATQKVVLKNQTMNIYNLKTTN